MKNQKHILIIGAGPAGLEAGLTLLKQNIPFTILEASSKIGGRVQDMEGFAEFPLEIGAEFAHEDNSLNIQYCKELGYDIISTEDTQGLIEYDGKLISDHECKNHDDIQKVFEIAEKVEVRGLTDDISLDEYCAKEKMPQHLRYLMTGLFGDDSGEFDISKMSVKVLSQYGINRVLTDNFISKGSQSSMLRQVYRDVIPYVKLNTPIKKVFIKGENEVVLETLKGDEISGSSVIVAVPLQIIKDKVIQFEPELSLEKQCAFDRLQMGQGIKVFLKFKERFWPETVSNFLLDGDFNCVWSSSYGKENVEKSFIITTIMNGDRGIQIGKLPKEEIAEIALKQFEKFYGKAVRENYVDTYVKNWSEEQYIRGTYCYAALNEDGARGIIGDHKGNLTFAGEYCMEDDFATITSAMRSGRKAANYLAEN